MMYMPIGIKFCSSIRTIILIFGLLLIISFYTQQKAGAQAVLSIQPEDEDSCVLQQDSQSPIWIKNASPNKRVAVLTGLIQDPDTLKGGECAGTEVGLNPYRKIITLIMNEEGEKEGEIYIPPTVARTGFIQMVDLATCHVGEIKQVSYTDGGTETSCVYSFPEDDNPMIYSGPVSATGTVFHSKPFCGSTLNISGVATVTVYNGTAQVVQNLTRVFGVPGDGCFSGYRDSSATIFNLDIEQIDGSPSIEGVQKGADDSYTWKLTGEEQILSGSFVIDHHYCCGNGNHTGTASGDVTLSRQNNGK